MCQNATKQNETGVRIEMTKRLLLLFTQITQIDFRRKIDEWIFGIYLVATFISDYCKIKQKKNMIDICLFMLFQLCMY